MSASDIPLTISWFPTAMPEGPAIGDPECMTWSNFVGVFWWRREGPKDGPCFAAARFKLEADGRHVRRLGANLLARTAIALDIEANKITGEVPPPIADTVERIRKRGWAAVVYTSHSHRPEAPRYRVVLPLSEELDHELPAPEIVAGLLGVTGVMDTSKVNASSLFYLPSMASEDDIDVHETVVIDGRALNSVILAKAGAARLAKKQAEQERIAAEARAEAAARREAKIAAGFNPDDSLLEKLRAHFDLEQVLLSHGYKKSGTKFRHANSQSGCFGADIKTLAGIARVYSHNGTDPLHRDNLPSWCAGVTALDAIDAVIILDFGGNRTKALSELAQRFGLTKAEERRALASLMFRLIREDASQQHIEAAAYSEGERLGLSRSEVIQVAAWVVNSGAAQEAA